MVSKENLNLVNITQKKWADIVLEIGKAYKQKINLDNLIFELLNNVYAFNQCEVIFKPTILDTRLSCSIFNTPSFS